MFTFFLFDRCRTKGSGELISGRIFCLIYLKKCDSNLYMYSFPRIFLKYANSIFHILSYGLIKFSIFDKASLTRKLKLINIISHRESFVEDRKLN